MLTSQEHALTKVTGIYFFSSALAGIFLQFYVFKYVNFSGLVYYNAVLLAFLVIAYIASGYLLKIFTTKLLIQSSLVLTTFFYILLFVFKEQALAYLAFLGMLSGISAGLYWSGYNLSQYILTHSHSRDHFFGRNMSIMNITSALAPVLGGMIVNYFGYAVLFGIVGVFNAYLLLVAQKLPVHTGIRFSIKHIHKHARSKGWNMVLLQNFVLGISDAGFSVIGGIIFFLVLKDPTVVGIARSVIFLISATVSIYASKLILRHARIAVWAGIIATVGNLIFAVYQTPLGIILYSIIGGVSLPILNIMFNSTILNTMDETNEPWEEKYHLFIERDTVLGIARVLSMGILLMLFGYFEKYSVATWWIVVVSPVPFLLGILLYKGNKNTAQ